MVHLILQPMITTFYGENYLELPHLVKYIFRIPEELRFCTFIFNLIQQTRQRTFVASGAGVILAYWMNTYILKANEL